MTPNPLSIPKGLVHLTLNTGDSRLSPLHEVSRDILDGLAHLVTQKGAPPFPIPWDVTLRIDAKKQFGAFALTRGKMPLVSCVVAFSSKGRNLRTAWRTALQGYHADEESRRVFGGATPKKPASTPWLTVQLHRGIAHLPLEQILMLGDFERCLGWSIIEQFRVR